MRHEIAHLIHDVDTQFAVRNSDVNVHAKNQQPARDVAHVLGQAFVAVFVCENLILPARKRVGAGSDDLAAVLLSDLGHDPPQPHHFLARLFDVAANMAADLYLRLQHLGFDLIPKDDGTLLQKL